MTKDDIIRMAQEAKIIAIHAEGATNWAEEVEALERFAALARAGDAKRADALAATIAALRDIVTSEAESKADFIARVRDVLGACPDQRVLHAVEAAREASAKDQADAFVAGFMCAGGDVGEAQSQARQFVSCCNAARAGVES